MTYICVSNLNDIGSDNGLGPDRRQSIIWTNAGILLSQMLETIFREVLSEIHAFHSRKCIWKRRLQYGGNIASASMC